MTYAYGGAFKAQIAQNVAKIEGWNTHMFKVAGNLKGSLGEVNRVRGEMRTSTEHVYRVTEDLKRLGLVSDDFGDNLRKFLGIVLITSHAVMTGTVLKEFIVSLKKAYETAGATADTAVALAQGPPGWANIAFATSVASSVAIGFGIGYAFGRQSVEVDNVNINNPIDQRKIGMTFESERLAMGMV